MWRGISSIKQEVELHCLYTFGYLIYPPESQKLRREVGLISQDSINYRETKRVGFVWRESVDSHIHTHVIHIHTPTHTNAHARTDAHTHARMHIQTHKFSQNRQISTYLALKRLFQQFVSKIFFTVTKLLWGSKNGISDFFQWFYTLNSYKQ